MVQPGTNRQSVAAIQLRNGGVTGSGMCLSLGKSLPSLGHLNQKGLLPRINGRACVLQAPHSVSLAIFQPASYVPLTNELSEFCWRTPRPEDQEMELGWTTVARLGSASKRSAA